MIYRNIIGPTYVHLYMSNSTYPLSKPSNVLIFIIIFVKGSSDNNLDSTGVELDENVNHSNQKESSDLIGNEKTYLSMTSDPQNRTTIQPHRANTTIQVCWHRNTSVSFNDNHHSLVNQLSGYLLRKFKNSNGWQKLWVVFSNFCLFFYKTYQVGHQSVDSVFFTVYLS